MAPELIYILKVNIGIALFYAFYKLFCCRDTFFQWRRIALLSFLALSFLYPLLDIQNWVKEQPAISELADYYSLLMMTNTSLATNAATPTETAGTLPMPDIMTVLMVIYFCGVLLLFIRFIIQLLSIFRLALKSKEVTVGGIRVRSLPSPANPFSFWQWIFISLPGLEKEEKQEIMTHELTHVRQWHSIDVILSEIVNIICWMNPFSWLLKTEIRLNLEYLADHKVVETITDTRQYQYHLLGLANQNRQTGLYNNFNLSHLKNRIMMMNKKRTRTTGRIKYALFAPLAAALLLVSNIETVARTAERLISPAEESTAVTRAEIPEPETVATATEGAVTYHVTVTNSEGKPQPGINLQTKFINEIKNFKTDAEGKATISLDMGNLKYVTIKLTAPQSKRTQSAVLSSDKPDMTIVFDTDNDIANYIKAGKQVLVKLRVQKNDNTPVSGAELVSSSSHTKATANAQGEAQMKVGVGETITISKKGYQNGKFTVADIYPIEDMEKFTGTRLLLMGEDPVYQVTEHMPEFPGGMRECLKYLSRNVKYPADAQKAGTQGKVIVQAIIEKDGTVNHVFVVRSIDPELDAEAVRVVKSMPKWKPAMEKGEAVRCRYTLPIAFKLP